MKKAINAFTEICETSEINNSRTDKEEVTQILGQIQDELVRKLFTLSRYSPTKQKSLLVFKEKVSKDKAVNFPCKSLIDSGCEELVAAKQFAEKLKL